MSGVVSKSDSGDEIKAFLLIDKEMWTKESEMPDN